MKSILLIALTSLTIFGACNKKTASGDIKGTWELTEIRGMMLIDSIPDEFKEILTLNENTYELRVGDSVTTGTYTTTPDTTVTESVCLTMDPGTFTRRIDFSNINLNRKVFYQVDGSTFKTVSGCFAYDAGVIKTYKRKFQINQ